MTAATPSSPQPAEDLERVLAEIDALDQGGPDKFIAFRRALAINWPTIRAAFARERELREALGELADEFRRVAQDDFGRMWSNDVLDRASALLARSGEGTDPR